MATNGAPGSAQNDTSTPASPLTLDQTTLQLVHVSTASSSDNRPDTPSADQTIRDYFERHMTPALLPRSLGKTSVLADLPERAAFQMIQPAKVVEVQELIDNLSNDLPPASVDELKTVFSTMMAMNDTTAPRLVKLLENNLAMQLGLHATRQQEVLDLQQKLDARTYELDARIRDFDNGFDYMLQKKARSVLFAVALEDIDEIINNFDSKLDTIVRAAVAKVIDEDISGRTQKIVDCLQKQCEDIAKDYDTKSTAMDQLMDRLKTQQLSLASEIDKVRTDPANYMINNSSDFKECRSTMQKHEKETPTKSSAVTDDDIKRINDNIQALSTKSMTTDNDIKRINDVMTACCAMLNTHEDALRTISTRSKDNRTALGAIIATVALQTQVTSKLEQAVAHGRMLEDGQLLIQPNQPLLLCGGHTLTSRQIVTAPDTIFTSDICQGIKPVTLVPWNDS